jgi:hypothetical protein
MNYRQKLDFVRKMKEMGATNVVVDNVHVQFAPPPQPVDAQVALDAQVQRAINDIHEEKMDAEEIQDAESAKRAAKKNRKLFYAHGG